VTASRQKKGARDAAEKQRVVKRVNKGSHRYHGGQWKIAYADFVTAMMSFFLLMWLLGSTTQGDLEGIAEYFRTPLKVALAGGRGSGDSSSVVNGGGKDLTRRTGQVKRGDIADPKRTINLRVAENELERLEFSRLRVVKTRLEQVFDANPALREFRSQLLVDITSEGLRIQIVDAQNRPMFENGKADLLPHMREILHEIGRTLNEVPNKITLSGHTDAKPYASGEKGYSNWELSADRANASRRELISAGMDESKIVRVVGLSSSVLFDRSDPLNPVNRRISVIVMTRKAEESVSRDGILAPRPALAPIEGVAATPRKR
jgi:chemotaxis protein MotB